ncbi:uncharacterized protein [Henckelia pumila]|uniref:uncharacterized protein n=1 Tax=Henckelia pumila TaxID=405737 RepID=UPI003C6DDEA3
MGHMKRDCLQMVGESAFGLASQTLVPQKPAGQSVGGTNHMPCVPGQVFALSQDQVHKENGEVIADTGASHSFVLARFTKFHILPCISLDVVLSVSTPTGHSALAKRLVLSCTLEFEGSELLANFMVLAMEDFYCFLGIDVLTFYRATVDCYQIVVHFVRLRAIVGIYMVRERNPLCLWFKDCHALKEGGENYLIYEIDTSTVSRIVEELPIVYEYPDVFSDEISGFPQVREVEFGIELVLGTTSISRAPYHLTQENDEGVAAIVEGFFG